MLNIYRMLANSEQGAKGFLRMGNGLLYRCRARPGAAANSPSSVSAASAALLTRSSSTNVSAVKSASARRRSPLCATATIEAPAFTDNEKAVLRYTDDVVRNVRASDKTLKAVQAFLTPGALVELTLTIGYYMMVCRFLESMGVDGEEGQAEWLKTAKL